MAEEMPQTGFGAKAGTRRTFLTTVGAAGATALAGCIGGDGGEGGTVDISGSSTVYPITNAMAEEFQRNHSDIEVSISRNGTGGGFSNFCKDQTDINNASRKIADTEQEECSTNDVTPIEFTVANDAITIVVNSNADWIDCITTDELKQIWQPDGAEKWSDVRDEWPDEPFELYGAADTSGTFDYFTENIVGENGAHRTDYQGTEQDHTIVQGVQGSEYAMGYFGFSYYALNQGELKALAVDNGDGCVKPTFETAKTGEYSPLSRPLFIYLNKQALSRSSVETFTRFYLERTSESLIEEVGYVPTTEDVSNSNIDKLDQAVEDVSQ